MRELGDDLGAPRLDLGHQAGAGRGTDRGVDLFKPGQRLRDRDGGPLQRGDVDRRGTGPQLVRRQLGRDLQQWGEHAGGDVCERLGDTADRRDVGPDVREPRGRSPYRVVGQLLRPGGLLLQRGEWRLSRGKITSLAGVGRGDEGTARSVQLVTRTEAAVGQPGSARQR